MIKRQLVVRGVFRGHHNWPGAATAGFPQYEHLHPHFFHFEVLVRVGESREIEFNQLAQRTSARTSRWLYNNLGASCEDMAEYILHDLRDVGIRAFQVEVSEDGYSGARVILDLDA